MKLLSPKMLAELWAVPTSWVYGKVRDREIPYLKIGRYVRFQEEEVQGWLHEHRGWTPLCQETPRLPVELTQTPEQSDTPKAGSRSEGA